MHAGRPTRPRHSITGHRFFSLRLSTEMDSGTETNDPANVKSEAIPSNENKNCTIPTFQWKPINAATVAYSVNATALKANARVIHRRAILSGLLSCTDNATNVDSAELSLVRSSSDQPAFETTVRSAMFSFSR